MVLEPGEILTWDPNVPSPFPKSTLTLSLALAVTMSATVSPLRSATESELCNDPPAYETALKANNIGYTMHMYDDVNHGFHNDTTPRYDEAAAKLAWERTIAFFTSNLK